MNLPNSITLTRIAFIPVIVFFYEIGWFRSGWTLPTILFFVSLTDMLDGQMARRRNLVTDLGKLLDPLADKLLVLAVLLIVVDMRTPGAVIPAWSVVIILGREFSVSGLRSMAAAKNRILAASWGGKIKTSVTLMSLGFLLFNGPEPYSGLPFHVYGYWLYWVGLVITVITGVQYFWNNRDILLEE